MAMVEEHELQDEWRQSCQWAAITCVVVSAPVIGKVAQVSMERTIGTIVGGLLAYITFDHLAFWAQEYIGDLAKDLVLATSAALVSGASVVLSWALGLDQSTKLFAITFLLVTLGAHAGRAALAITVMRCSGIIAGMILTQAVSILVLPKSATVGSVREVRRALKALAELNQCVWEETLDELGFGDNGEVKADVQYTVLAGSSAEYFAEVRAKQDAYEKRCEKAFADVYSSVAKSKELLTQSKGEIYVWHFYGHYFFLPAPFAILPCGGLKSICKRWGQWELPADTMEELSSSVRRMARLLWALHIAFDEGFDRSVRDMMLHSQPTSSLPDLSQRLQKALVDLIEAFPRQRQLCVENLDKFGERVDDMLKVADDSRRRIISHMQTFRRRPTRPLELTGGTELSSVSFVDASGQHVGSVPKASHIMLQGGASQQGAGSATPPSMAEQLSPKHTPELDMCAPTASLGTRRSVEVPAMPPIYEVKSLSLTALASTLSDGNGQHTAAAAGSDVDLDPFAEAAEALGSDRGQPPSPASVDESGLYRPDSLLLSLFPPTQEGYVAQVRWYSFQFLMDEMVEEMEVLFELAGRVMNSLPYPL